MKKVAVFVEGQTEQIFVERLIHQIYGYQGIRVISNKIYGKSLFIRLQDDLNVDAVEFLFLVVNVDTDERVLSAMLDNAPRMAERGFSKIIGLRDLFPNQRSDKGAVCRVVQNLISKAEQADMMKLILADPDLFEEIHTSLTSDHIRAELDFDLKENDPEFAYEHPANVIKDIYRLAGLRYRKRAADTHKIANSLNYDTLYLDAREKGHIDSFFRFVRELESLDPPKSETASSSLEGPV